MVKTTLKNIQEEIKKELEDILMHHYQDDLQLNGSHPCLPLEVSIWELIFKAYKAGVKESKAFIGKAKREYYQKGFKEGKDRYKDLVAPPEFKNKAAVSEDICKIINNIEFSYRNTNLEEWKAFKHIRNAIRDKYVLTPKETYEEGYAKGQLDMIDIYNITPKDCNCGGNEENGHNESCKFYEEWA